MTMPPRRRDAVHFLLLLATAQALPRENSEVTLIHDLDDLQAMRGKLDGHYALGRTLDTSATTRWNGGAGFAPIGTSSRPFCGIFDGRGHVVRGLFIHRPGESQVGLFGCTRNATLRNIGVVAARITGAGNVGALVGCHGTADGGVARISHAYSSAQVRGTANNVGALVGHHEAVDGQAYLSHVHASGPVSGRDNVGGLVGHNEAYRGRACILLACASGPVTAVGNNVGGLVGHNEAFSGMASIEIAYASGPVAGRDYVGGLVGYNDALRGLVAISRGHARGAVSASGAVAGGLVGLNTNGRIADSFYATTDAQGQAINRFATSAGQGLTLEQFQQLPSVATWRSVDCGGVSATEPGNNP